MNIVHRIFWIGILISFINRIVCLDPRFDPSTRMKLVLIPADAAVGSVIYRLRATDEEFDYPLQFELIGDTSSSTVQIETLPCTKYNSVCQANVVLQRRLEPGRYYDFQVSVKDTKGGMAVQLCSITATNFTTPHDTIFPHKPGIIMILEDAKRGTELDYVIARKNPLHPKPVYLELWGSPLFAIRQKIVSSETTEGTVFLLGPLDFEKQAMYHLSILANDAYAEPGQDTRNIAGVDLVVIVQDVQDVPPVFTTAPPVTRLSPALLPGDKILKVHAEDGDKGNPREVRYGLVSEGNPFTSFFIINETTGEIFLLRPLDEILDITHVGDPILLTVIAEEIKVTRNEPPAMSTTVQLAFFLPERSNSPPYFENDHYISRVDENAAQGHALAFVDPYVPRVYDDDTGKNGVFSLTLLNNNGTFEISPNVAEKSALFLIKVRDNILLDYEERHSVVFQILAQELGPTTNLSTIVNVTVYINDINDNSPVFAESAYIVELPENMTVGTKVAQVLAEDIDTGIGGRVRYTQILGYLNTSLYLDTVTGIITVSTNNHGFDREAMPEYHFYVEARDNEGTGNKAQVPLFIKMIDVNDETPQFEKSVYEFILSSDLKGFTTPAFIKAIDNDATSPNNEVRYEIVNGNYENKFLLHKITGEISIKEKLILQKENFVNHDLQKRQTHHLTDENIFVLTARAYDLGVPVRFSTTTIRVYPPESRTRTVTFVVPGHNIDRKKTEETLSTITGGQVIIHDIRPLNANDPGAKNFSGNFKERSVITATVLYDGNSVVDISHIQQRLSQHNSSFTVMTREEQNEIIYKAENRLLFWLLILLAVLIAITILTLLFCCICSWCPLYGATSKRVINVSNPEDDVHLVHREKTKGNQTKSVQVAEWMGRREAWSAEKSSDSRSKPTHWEFSRHNYNENMRKQDNVDIDDDDLNNKRKVKSADEHKIKIKNKMKHVDNAKDLHFYDSKTNLINDNEIYEEDINEQRRRILKTQVKLKHANRDDQNVDDDSMRRHEIDRGSEIDYGQDSLKQKADRIRNQELFIKDGNAEILQFMTRSKQDEDNIYVNLPSKRASLSQPHLVMLDNSGKEILMRRFIEEQPDGKQIIREHYQIVPGTTYIQAMPNEVQRPMNVSENLIEKSGPNSVVYSQLEPEIRVIHTQPTKAGTNVNVDTTQIHPADSIQSLHRELETSLKQQNALLRQILLEKEKLEERFNQQEVAFETQSLPCQSMAIATQTDCEAETQTDFPFGEVKRRKARSENDDSVSEDEYEYVQFSPPNDSNDVYWMKKRKQRRKLKNRYINKPRKKVVMVEEIKRKIRTPIKEENEEIIEQKKRQPLKKHAETKTSILRKMKNGVMQTKSKLKRSSPLNKEVLMEISDSLDENASPGAKEKRKHTICVKKVAYYENSEDDSDGDEIIIRKNTYSADSNNTILNAEEEPEHRFEIHLTDLRNKTCRQELFLEKQNETEAQYEHQYTNTPIAQPRFSKKGKYDKSNKIEKDRNRQTTSESPTRLRKGLLLKPSQLQKKSKINYEERTQSTTDIVDKLQEDYSIETSKGAPRYMDWYYNKKKDSENVKFENQKGEKIKSKISNKKHEDSERKIKSRLTNADDYQFIEGKYKPEPLPRKSPVKGMHLLKEEIITNKDLKPTIEIDSNHPLLQHSEHRFERDYDQTTEIPIPPTKLPHYMYPETPPFITIESKNKPVKNISKSKPSPIKENEVSRSKTTVYIEDNTQRSSSQTQSKQLNVAALEDDHDSGIVMNTLLTNMGKRNPIADKKSVFTIAYDDVSKVKKIQSGSDSPLLS